MDKETKERLRKYMKDNNLSTADIITQIHSNSQQIILDDKLIKSYIPFLPNSSKPIFWHTLRITKEHNWVYL